jgi:3'-5' exoribonuclease
MTEARLSLAELRAQVAATACVPVRATVHTQVLARNERATRDQKPYFDLELGDGTTVLRFKIWNNHPFFARCAELEAGAFIEATGEFADGGKFGPEFRTLECRELNEIEREELLLGSPDRRARLDADFAEVVAKVETIRDPRLREICALFLRKFEARFRRAAAARNYHHARRGGLLEHVAQMLRAAVALCDVYANLNRDLVVAGVLFHDCGKLWECCPAERGFAIEPNETGELLGHISIGFELVNRLWNELRDTGTLAAWEEMSPKSEHVRQHLLHLVASHHGEMQFGSPVLPKTPEAMLLHFVDNIDARLEMLAGAYANAAELAPGVFERVPPLSQNAVRPLPPWSVENL